MIYVYCHIIICLYLFIHTAYIYLFMYFISCMYLFLSSFIHLLQLVYELQSSGVLQECRKLCDDHSTKAVSALASLRPSDAKTALNNIVHAIRRV